MKLSEVEESYDVVLFFVGIPISNIHKYLALCKELSGFCKPLMIISNDSKWGISSEILENYYSQHLDNVVSVSNSDAFGLLSKCNYKLGVFNSICRKYNIGFRDVEIAKSKNINTLQISDLAGDFHYAGADIVSFMSLFFHQNISSYSNISCKNVMYSNCLAYEPVDECLPYSMTKVDFCNKYGLDFNKPIYLWAPDSVQCNLDNISRDIYSKITNLENTIVKLHPNELRGYKLELNGGKNTFQTHSSSSAVLLDPIDTHWCYTHMDYMICYTSSVGMESAFYNKPAVYIDGSENELLKNHLLYLNGFEWVGYTIDYKDIDNFSEILHSFPEKKMQDYVDYRERILQDSNKTSIELLSRQIGQEVGVF